MKGNRIRVAVGMGMLSVCAGITAVGLGSCAPEERQMPKADADMAAAMAAASPTLALSYYQMPLDGDYAAIPQDPRNPITREKVELGKLLYHETGLLVSPKRPEGKATASCSSCHHVAAGFQAGRIQGVGEGGKGFGVHGDTRVNDPGYSIADLDVQPIRSPSAMNAAYQSVMLWNGQFGGDQSGPNKGTQASWTTGTPKQTNELLYQGLETQAIAGLKVHRMDPIEAGPATMIEQYRTMFTAAFPQGAPYNGSYRLREQAGLAIAAYERTLLANQSPFQRWLRGERGAMSTEEKQGAALFFGKAQCASCHNGPALNSMAFYGLGMADLPENLNGAYGDVLGKPEQKGRGGFTGKAEDMYKFKVPQLYNLKDSPFYGHGGTFTTVRQVVEYKNGGVAENTNVPAGQLALKFKPLGLTAEEVTLLTRFLEDSLYDPDLRRYVPPTLPTGLCFPNADPQSQADLGFGRVGGS